MYLVKHDKEPPSTRDAWEAQLRRGVLELAILATLANRRLYGLEIIRELKERSALDVAEGTIYPILSRLRADGFVETEWVDAETGHPRKYYWLTKTGVARAESLARTWTVFARNLSSLVDPLVRERKSK